MRALLHLTLAMGLVASGSCASSKEGGRKVDGSEDSAGDSSEDSAEDSSEGSAEDSSDDSVVVRKDAGPAVRDAGRPPDAGRQSDAGKASGQDAGGATVSDAAEPSGDDGGKASAEGNGLEPIIPEISGECPVIKMGTSTATVMGSRATIIAGLQKQGTGSLLIYYYGTGKLGDVNSLPAAIKTDITAQGGIVFALNEAKNTGGDCSGTGTFGIDDFKVVDQFVACAVKNYGIDPKRIYATGCSAGGLTSGCMAIMRSSYVAGVAPNSGGVTIRYGKLQDPTRVPNVITMNGGSGDNVIVNFGETSEGYDNYILKAGGFAVNCVHSSGHCGAPAALYQSAWQFLKDHPFGTKPSPYAGGLPSGFHSSCKVFTMTSRAPLGGF